MTRFATRLLFCITASLAVVGCAPLASSKAMPDVTILSTSTPEQASGVRGTLTATSGPAPENGGMPTPAPQFGVRLVVLDAATQQVVVESQSGSHGAYELKLPPGKYTVCIRPDDREMCTADVLVKPGKFVTVDFGYGLQ